MTFEEWYRKEYSINAKYQLAEHVVPHMRAAWNEQQKKIDILESEIQELIADAAEQSEMQP